MSIVTALRPRHVAWLPAALLIAYLIAAASGMTTPMESRAASSDTTIEAEVLEELHMAMGACAAPGGTVDNDLNGSAPDWDWARTINADNLTIASNETELGNCVVTFGTNNDAAGAELVIANSRGAGNAFCTNALPGTCAAATGTFTNPAAPVGSLADGEFGFALASKTNCANGLATAQRHPLTNAAAMVCETSAITTGAADGSVNVSYHANPASNQVAGTYRAESLLTVQPK